MPASQCEVKTLCDHFMVDETLIHSEETIVYHSCVFWKSNNKSSRYWDRWDLTVVDKAVLELLGVDPCSVNY